MIADKFLNLLGRIRGIQPFISQGFPKGKIHYRGQHLHAALTHRRTCEGDPHELPEAFLLNPDNLRKGGD